MNSTLSIPIKAGRSATLVATRRIETLDFVKGMLVVMMVIYHSLNRSFYHPMAFKYLAFLPPSFIFITGFILTQVYVSRYDVRGWKLHRRLLVRGAKLILLFTLLNVLIYSFVLGPADNPSLGFAALLERWREIYLEGKPRAAMFHILLAIGYLLILAPMLLRLQSWNNRFVPILAVVAIAGCLVLESKGAFNVILMLTAGLLGMAIGMISISKINSIARKWFLAVSIYLGYRLLSYKVGDSFGIQMLGVLATLLALYSIALSLSTSPSLSHFFTLLGNYSLLAYITQILLLQAIVRLIVRPENNLVVVIATMLVTVAATYFVVWTADRWRRKMGSVDAAYKAVFT